MKVGDLVQPCEDDFGGSYGVGIIIGIVDQHWDPELPGYTPGGMTCKVMFENDYRFFNDDELKIISES